MKKDLNEIAKIEKAIKEKYGDEAIQNPKKSWDEAKEKKYLKDLKKFYKLKKHEKTITERDGFVIKERAVLNKINRKCPICSDYSFSTKDNLYMNKFKCCEGCYIQYIEDREERWKTGWRPKN